MEVIELESNGIWISKGKNYRVDNRQSGILPTLSTFFTNLFPNSRIARNTIYTSLFLPPIRQ
jgi:hypothetical protein